jgi:hypothetical protein
MEKPESNIPDMPISLEQLPSETPLQEYGRLRERKAELEAELAAIAKEMDRLIQILEAQGVEVLP